MGMKDQYYPWPLKRQARCRRVVSDEGLDVFRKSKFLAPTGIRAAENPIRSLASILTRKSWLLTGHWI